MELEQRQQLLRSDGADNKERAVCGGFKKALQVHILAGLVIEALQTWEFNGPDHDGVVVEFIDSHYTLQI